MIAVPADLQDSRIKSQLMPGAPVYSWALRAGDPKVAIEGTAGGGTLDPWPVHIVE